MKWGNAHGKWKGYREPPHVIIKQESCGIAKRLGYRPYPYYYADGHSYRVWQMQLKTGCVTEEEVVEWHEHNTIKEIGVTADEQSRYSRRDTEGVGGKKRGRLSRN